MRSFDEFKGFYNAAIDDARGRERAPKPSMSRSKTQSGLSDETKVRPARRRPPGVGAVPTRPRLPCAAQNARKKLAEEKARKKAEEAERIRKENAEMKARPHLAARRLSAPHRTPPLAHPSVAARRVPARRVPRPARRHS